MYFKKIKILLLTSYLSVPVLQDMKYLLLLFSIPFFFFSCNKENFDPDRNPDLLGTWKVTERYSDPGDGSGDFQDVDYDRTFTFFADGRITSDRDICLSLYGFAEEGEIEGAYDVATGIITANLCEPPQEFRFALNGRQLTFSFNCIEACTVRLRKLR